MKLLLVRGLPGSGKSTLAKNLIGFYYHVETDMFWMQDGEYKWDANRLGEAHAWCLNRTRELMASGFSPVVSNTFTTIKEMRPYFDLAKEFNIVPTVMVAQNEWGNVHNVPEETLAKMKARFQFDISELFKKEV
jgi:predicted kinase